MSLLKLVKMCNQRAAELSVIDLTLEEEQPVVELAPTLELPQPDVASPPVLQRTRRVLAQRLPDRHNERQTRRRLNFDLVEDAQARIVDLRTTLQQVDQELRAISWILEPESIAMSPSDSESDDEPVVVYESPVTPTYESI